MLILDLNSEQEPLWQSTHSYFGKPFIWCLLHNYGGTRGIYGNLTTIAVEPLLALRASGSTMVGVGMTPEAIEHNPVVYDLMVSEQLRQLVCAYPPPPPVSASSPFLFSPQFHLFAPSLFFLCHLSLEPLPLYTCVSSPSHPYLCSLPLPSTPLFLPPPLPSPLNHKRVR